MDGRSWQRNAASSARTRFQASVELGAHRTGWRLARRDAIGIIDDTSSWAGNTIPINNSLRLLLNHLHRLAVRTSRAEQSRENHVVLATFLPVQLPQPTFASCTSSTCGFRHLSQSSSPQLSPSSRLPIIRRATIRVLSSRNSAYSENVLQSVLRASTAILATSNAISSQTVPPQVGDVYVPLVGEEMIAPIHFADRCPMGKTAYLAKGASVTVKMGGVASTATSVRMIMSAMQ